MKPSRISYVPLGVLAMAVNRSPEYQNSFTAFSTRLAKALAKHHNSDEKGRGVALFQQQGRVFDKIVIQHVKDGKNLGKPAVVFYVRIADGQVFGAKSEIAPNLNHWYGSLATAEEWDFVNPYHPVPHDPSKFKVAKQYGEYTHYLPVDMRIRLADRKTPLPDKRTKRKVKV